MFELIWNILAVTTIALSAAVSCCYGHWLLKIYQKESISGIKTKMGSLIVGITLAWIATGMVSALNIVANRVVTHVELWDQSIVIMVRTLWLFAGLHHLNAYWAAVEHKELPLKYTWVALAIIAAIVVATDFFMLSA